MNAATIQRTGARADRKAPGRGFTLIEILIAVIILALGLLGLGVVFPVVIREQKIAQDRIYGTLAENNIRSMLAGMGNLNKPPQLNASDYAMGVLTLEYTGWAALKEDWNYYKTIAGTAPLRPDGRPNFANRFDFSTRGLWVTDWNQNRLAPTGGDGYRQSGNVQIVGADTLNTAVANEFPPSLLAEFVAQFGNAGRYQRWFFELSIPLSQRINPAANPADDTPAYVWDFVVRRKLESDDPRALQVAVFVRRVDPALRPIPRPSATAGNLEIPVREQILSSTLAAANQRLPVGEDADGLPTFDGTDGTTPPGGLRYSGVHAIDASFAFNDVPAGGATDNAKRVWIKLGQPVGAFPNDPALAQQIGQRLVDNLGNTYTVVGSDGQYVKVDPPVPTTVLDSDPDPMLESIRQLAFTAQIPVSVFIVEIEP